MRSASPKGMRFCFPVNQIQTVFRDVILTTLRLRKSAPGAFIEVRKNFYSWAKITLSLCLYGVTNAIAGVMRPNSVIPHL